MFSFGSRWRDYRFFLIARHPEPGDMASLVDRKHEFWQRLRLSG